MDRDPVIKRAAGFDPVLTMKLTLLDKYQGPVWKVAGALLLCTGSAAIISFAVADGEAHQMFASTSHIVGTVLMLSVLPCYLTAAFIYLRDPELVGVYGLF